MSVSKDKFGVARKGIRTGGGDGTYYLLREEWDGSAIGPNWSVTDTGSKLTVNGGNLVGAAGAAWDDPRLSLVKSFTIAAGIILEFEYNAGTLGATGLQVGFDPTAPIASVLYPGFLLLATPKANAGAAQVALPITLSAATSYLFRLVLKATGATWYYSTNSGATWKVLWDSVAAVSGPLYCGYDNYDAIFTSSYIRVWQGTVRPAAISVTPSAPTPTLGSDELTANQQELGTDTTGWTGSNCTVSRVDSATDPGTGSGGTDSWCLKCVDAGAAAMAKSGNLVGVIGTWYYASCVLYAPSANTATNAGKFAVGNTSGGGTEYGVYTLTAEDVWQMPKIGFRATATALHLAAINQGGADNDIAYFDAFTVKPLTLASLLSLAGTVPSRDGVYDIILTSMTAGTQLGMALFVDDVTNPTYGLYCYKDGTNLNLVRQEGATTWTSSIAAASAFSAGEQLRVVVVGNGIAAYAAGVQIGTTQTIDLSAYGYQCAAFSTLVTNVNGALTVNQGW